MSLRNSGIVGPFMHFKDQVVWITGASSGIGEALALAFHAQGAKLILSARRVDKLEQVKAACGGGDDVAVFPLDVEKITELPAQAAQALAIFGKCDILVNNAGVTQRSLAKDTKIEVEERIMRLDFLAQVALTKAVLPSMLARQSGCILTISSLAGIMGTPYRSAYSAAKHALRGYFDALRAEVHRDGIQVTMAYPGYIQTEITLHALKGDGSKFDQMGTGQQEGMPAEQCAKKILRAVERGKDEVYPGGKEVWAVYAKPLFPGLFARMIRNYKIE
jgi:dehydrogenase/reductase SDR family member 7B